MKNIVAVVAAASLVGTAAFAKEPAKQMVRTPPSDLKWQPIMPNNPDAPQIALVHGDMKKGPVSFFIKINKGVKGPVHSHTADYQAVVIQGNPVHWADGEEDPKPLPPGSFFFQPGKQMHGDGCTGDTDCISFVSMNGPFDAQMKAAPKADAKAGKAESKPAPK